MFFRAENNPSALPASRAEVIFAGRSNVGKSSVINALCRQKNLARTSKTPGRTRSINVYSIVMGKWLIDLPGYGFARVNPNEKKLWKAMIEDCIINRDSKKRVYLIIDALVGPTELDLNMAEWLADNEIQFKIIANKCDKLPSVVTMPEIQSETAKVFESEIENIFTVSAKQKNGFEKLRADVVKFLEMKK